MHLNNLFLFSHRKTTEEAKSKSTVYGALLRQCSNTNAFPKPFVPYQDDRESGDSAHKVPGMNELKSAPGSSKHHYNGTGVSPSTVTANR